MKLVVWGSRRSDAPGVFARFCCLFEDTPSKVQSRPAGHMQHFATFLHATIVASDYRQPTRKRAAYTLSVWLKGFL